MFTLSILLTIWNKSDRTINSISLYDRFIAKAIARKKSSSCDLSSLLNTYLKMSQLSKIERINKLKNWLNSFRPFSSPIVVELKKIYDVGFTYNSNAIEGNTLTQSETELVLTKGITVGGKTLEEHLEVVGHKEAIDYVETFTQQNTTIKQWEIKQIHNLILRKINPLEAGSYRTLDVRAAGTNYLYTEHYLIPQLMSDFITWLNSEEALKLHPVEYAATAHYRFISIHPFRAGNGRTARLLMNLLLIRAGYPIVIINNQIRNDCINALAYEQQNKDDLTQLLALVYDATISSLVETLRLLATAADSKDKGKNFYREMIEFMDSIEDKN